MSSEALKGFVKGQRILNESDPQMGLGCVEELIDDRLLRVYFPAKSQECLYRIGTAPLRRVILQAGSIAVDRQGHHFRIERVEEKDGLVTYWRGNQSIAETDLEDKIPLATSLGRMRYGSVGYPEDLPLRLAAHNLKAKMLSSEAYFSGASRVTLLPHQLYVTRQVTSMLAPRVLLSDEVGLGKTIEAGLIFSVLRTQGRASRVLIVLPDSLTYQWLAEMARRFNEIFSLVDKEALNEEDPYWDARRAITPWTALKDGLLSKASRYEWDLLIVDEAHHLHEGQAAYEAVSRLATISRSVLLLTATPSRGGLETEFGLLRLVDPKRFVNFDSYCREREDWYRGSALAKQLQNRCQNLEKTVYQLITPTAQENKLNLSPTDQPEGQEATQTSVQPAAKQDSAQQATTDKQAAIDNLKKILAEISSHYEGDQQISTLIDQFSQKLEREEDFYASPAFGQARHQLLAALIDRHGPGRMLFRNRRIHLAKLFSGRSIHPVPLSRKFNENVFPGLKQLTTDVIRQDPRILWIASYVLSHPGEKIVLIANRMQLVTALQERLRDIFGIESAIFHEGLSVVERDRQAVWFTEAEGADILLCSEIGSEGRNFQAAHTLIFWDIPVHPDAVEQRIGRLDRIGQTQRVDVYVLYFRGGKEERLFAWHKALGSFDGPVEGGEEIVRDVALLSSLDTPDFNDLISRSLQLKASYQREAEANVDYLVDLNSFDQTQGEHLVRVIEDEDKQFNTANTIIRLLERFGVTVDETSTPHLYHLSPSKNMQMDMLTRLHEGGMLATFDRNLAITREEVEYLTGAHPLVKELMSFALDGTEGSASAATWKDAPQDGVLVQFLFIFEALGADSLELGRYLTPMPLLINVSLNGTIYKGKIPEPKQLKRIKPKDAASLWEKISTHVEILTEKVSALVQSSVDPIRDKALRKAKLILGNEKSRLQELSKVNNLVTEAEINAQDDLNEEVYSAIADAGSRLDAIRVIVMEKKQ